MIIEPEYLELNQAQRSNISENLRELMELKKTTETKIAQDLNIPVMTVRRLLSGETTDPRIFTLKTIADYFRVSLDSLVGTKKLNFYEMNQPSKPIFVPIFDWEDVKNIDAIDLNKWKTWMPVTIKNDEQVSTRVFALESRPSMYPPFHLGTIFILDPVLKPLDGDLVLINLLKNNELTLREVSIDPPDWNLRSVSQSTNVLNFSKEEHEIIAVVFLTLFYNRKMRST